MQNKQQNFYLTVSNTYCQVAVTLRHDPGLKGLRFKFGRRLRELRLGRNWSQEMLAEEIETSAHFVSLIERGVNAPSFETLETLATALKVEIKDLFDFPAKDSPVKTLRRKLRNI